MRSVDGQHRADRSIAVRRASAWWPGRPTRRRADGLSAAGASSHVRRALVVLAPYLWLVVFFLVPLPDRPQDQPVADRDRAAALCAGARPRGRLGRLQELPRRPRPRQLSRRSSPTSSTARPISGASRSRRVDRDPARSSAIRSPTAWRARRSACRRAGDAGDPAVLDLVPDPRLRLDQHPAGRRAAQSRLLALHLVDAPVAWLSSDTAIYHRHRLFLSAVHGAAALRDAGEDGRHAARGRRRSRRAAATRRSGGSPFRCRCPASAPARCSASSRSSASSSSPTCSAAPTR